MADYVKVGKNQYEVPGEADLDQIETQYDTAKSEFRNGAWTMLGDLVPDANGGVDIGSATYRFGAGWFKRMMEERHHIRDDFIGSALRAKLWTAAYTGSGSGALQTDVDGGIYKLSTGVTNPSTAKLDFNAKRAFRHAKNARFEAYIKIDQTTQLEAEIGFWKDATHYCMFNVICAASAANWYAKSDNGGSTNSTDSTITTDNSWHTLTIVCVSGHVYFYIDGTQRADFSANIPTDYWEPRLHIKTTNTTDKGLSIDRVDLEQDY